MIAPTWLRMTVPIPTPSAAHSAVATAPPPMIPASCAPRDLAHHVPGGQDRHSDRSGGAGGQQAERQPGGGEGDQLGGQQRGAPGRDQHRRDDRLVAELDGDGERTGQQREGLRQPGQREGCARRVSTRGVGGRRGRRRDRDGDQGERADGEQPEGAGAAELERLGADQSGHDGTPSGSPVSSR